MALEPEEIYGLVQDVHLPELSAYESVVLAATVCSWRPAQIGERLFRSERDVRRVVENLTDAIARPTGASQSLALLGLWFAIHTDCKYGCTANALSLLNSGAVFSSA